MPSIEYLIFNISESVKSILSSDDKGYLCNYFYNSNVINVEHQIVTIVKIVYNLFTNGFRNSDFVLSLSLKKIPSKGLKNYLEY